MQQRSSLRRRTFLRGSTRIAAFIGALALVIGGGIVGASTANADVPSVSVYGDFTSSDAEAYLYSTSGGVVTSSIPVEGFDYADSSFEFDGVVAGTYAIAFRDGKTGKWLPWLSHTDGSVADATGGASSCLLPVDVDASDDVYVGSVTLGSGSTSNCGAPWGTASSFSGTISNMPPAATVSAWLYYLGADDSLIPVNRAPVSSDGTYSIDGVSLAGQYVVYLEIDDDSPFLATWSDGSDAPDGSDPGSAPVAIAADTDYAAPAINLVAAAVLSGQVTDTHGNPVADAEVEASTAPGQPGAYYSIATTDANGNYSLMVKPGVHYVFDVQASGFSSVFWPNAEDVGDAIVVTASQPGQYPSHFDFSLTRNGTEVAGLIVKASPSDESPEPFANVTASLYKRTGSYWKKISTQSAVDPDGVNEYQFDFSEVKIPALSSGDFRLRFHSPSGWVAVAEYLSLDLSNPNPQFEPVVGPVCFVPILGLKLGAQLLTIADVNPEDTTTKCGDERQPAGSRPRGVTNTHLASTGTALPTATPTPSPTASPTDTASPIPTDAAAPSPTPTPVVADSTSGLPAWLWWALGALVVVIAGIIVWLVVFRPKP